MTRTSKAAAAAAVLLLVVATCIVALLATAGPAGSGSASPRPAPSEPAPASPASPDAGPVSAPPPAAETDADPDVAALIACGRTLPTDQLGRGDAACMTGTIASLVDRHGIPATHLLLRRAQEQYPALELQCHASALAAARASGTPLHPALGQLTADACKGGLARGLIAAWADAGGPTPVLREAVAGCEQAARALPGDEGPRTLGRCANAIGLGLWEAGRDPSRCALFAGSGDVRGCALGFLQQMYQPDGAGTVVPRVSLEEAEAWCTRWPADLPVTDCYSGLAFAESFPYTAAMDQARHGDGTTDDAYRILQDVVARCRSLDPSGACESALVSRMPRQHGDFPGAPPQHCDAFAPDIAAFCRTELARAASR